MNIHAQSDKYLEVKVVKEKNGEPTVIIWQGKTFIRRHGGHYSGKKKGSGEG